MECLNFDMGVRESLGFYQLEKKGLLGFVFRAVFGFWVGLALLQPVAALRPLRERARSWGDEVCILNFCISNA